MILFRADGNSQIGTGHIMRCLSIAEAYRKNGEEAVFALADDSLERLIHERGFETAVFGTDHTNMAEETEQLFRLVGRVKPECIFVDSYYVTPDYLRRLRQAAKTVYIDDLASFAYPADVLINYNIYAEETEYEKIYETADTELPELLLGVRYVPLREEFANVRRKEVSERCTDVLISTGGADPIHLAKRLAEHIPEDEREDLTYHILVGAANPDKEKIRDIAGKKANIVVHSNVKNMKELICSCDIAVSAAGSTLYEICACGVPLITYVLADNQIRGAKGFEKKGLAVSCGDIRGTAAPEKTIFEAIAELADDPGRRQELQKNMGDIVNGSGAERIAELV